MLPEGTIQAHRIWKRFRADRRGALARDELQRLRARLRGDISLGWRWALRDIDFVANAGQSVGLIGANGSGKSTLLKILSRVMYPYAGRVTVSGRVGALIEVRAGIHSELTGRENVYLYGSLLGLKRADVAKRFDEIVAFAEVDEAIDRQVKFYSSGMQMRLGFAVAAFLEPDILLVDEVLAVGDASFQQKCLDRMREVLAQGTTLVFVSHDLAAVEATCSEGVWLHSGEVQTTGSISDVLGAYRRAIEESAESAVRPPGILNLLKVDVTGPEGGTAKTQDRLSIRVVIGSPIARSGRLFIGVSEGPATPIFSLRRDLHFVEGETEARCTIENLPLPRGRFYLWVGVLGGSRGPSDLLAWHPAAHFDVAGPQLDPTPRAVVRLAPVYVESNWEIERL